MSVEQVVKQFLKDRQNLNEGKDVTAGAVAAEKTNLDPAVKDENKDNKKNNVDNQKAAEGGTSKVSNAANDKALPAEKMQKVMEDLDALETDEEVESYIDGLDEETANELFEMLDLEEEQIDELSKKTLGSYAKKAIASKERLGKDRESIDNTRTKLADVGYNTDSKTRDSLEPASNTLYKQSRKIKDKINTREIGIHRSINKLTKEDIDLTEDVNALFNGEDGLTEEFRQKAETIFEAAVTSRIKQEVERIEESLAQEYEQMLEEEVTEVTQGLIESVDGYLDLMVKQWIKDNEVSLQAGLKTEVLESFVSDLKNVFENNYIDIPEEKVDVISALTEQVEALETKLNETTELNIQMNKSLNEFNKKTVIESLSKGLTDVQAEKFQTLAEEVTFENGELFETKLKTIRENYFDSKIVKPNKTTILNEENSEEVEVSGKMAKYVDHIKKTL
jgi:hypothetical protein